MPIKKGSLMLRIMKIKKMSMSKILNSSKLGLAHRIPSVLSTKCGISLNSIL